MSRNWAREDIAEVNRLSAVSPEAMKWTALMAILSIQQSWGTVPAAMADVKHEGLKSRFLWGFKAASFNFLNNPYNMEYLYAETMRYENIPVDVDLLDLWTTVPGLGLAKAGFVAQLTRGVIGCVDGHNAKQYDVHPGQLTFPKGRMTIRAQNHKLEAYVNLTRWIGGSEYMWKQWCVLMAAKYPETYGSPEEVSRQHVTLIEEATR